MDLADEHQASSMDLFTFLSREAEKTLRRSAELSVPQSAYDESRLAIPCPGTGPLRRRSPPAPLAVQVRQQSRCPPSAARNAGGEHLPMFQPARSLSRLLLSCLERELPCLLAGGLQQVSPLLCLPQHHLPGSLHLRPCRLRSLQPGVLRQHLTSWRSD
ncbi:hypothetical protein CRENBAI_025274 [Crenichthys baileyi]|uniref:Uncharacterized protein n=1 Tax=Crenichthys baileyi TaxID=28760 RepID=A0AAV9QVC9_9TELE